MKPNDIVIDVLPARRILLIQAHRDAEQAWCRLAQERFGLMLPARPAPCAPASVYTLWHAQGEWLLISDPIPDTGALAAAAFEDLLVKITDLSDAFASVRLGGREVGKLLNSDCGIDFGIQAFASGGYVRTCLGGVDVTVHRVDPDAFELHCERCSVEYLRSWLAAQAEYVAAAPLDKS